MLEVQFETKMIVHNWARYWGDREQNKLEKVKRQATVNKKTYRWTEYKAKQRQAAIGIWTDRQTDRQTDRYWLIDRCGGSQINKSACFIMNFLRLCKCWCFQLQNISRVVVCNQILQSSNISPKMPTFWLNVRLPLIKAPGTVLEYNLFIPS